MKRIKLSDSLRFEYHLTQLQPVRLMHYSFHHPWMVSFERTSNTKIIFSLLPDILKQECNIKKFPYLSPSRNKEQYMNGIIMWSFDVSLKDKIIVPFNTHAGSGSAGTYKKLFDLIGTPSSRGLNGLAINGTEVTTSDDSIKDWLTNLGYKVN